jgi:predicted transposase/invertase (TIGR01784 family)
VYLCKWLLVICSLHRLDRIPDKLRERVFEKLFETAEIARFTPDQIRSYEDSLKYYRDLKNSLDTAREEGREEGREEKALEIARELLKSGVAVSVISTATGLTAEQIERLK